ncbi:MAG: hypothetical protein JSW23_01315 [Planctomycetota bacterium]|nr:MAG: hypothetical protein JSW23_01315 [Planctomycetota bacterium]
MNEYEYIEKIDASFPYGEEQEWKACIDEGISISDNAAYMALHEICRASSDISRADSLKMLGYWSSKYHHDTKGVILEAAKALIYDTAISERDALAALNEIANYPGLYNAAAIVYFAAVPENENIQKKYDAIVRRWRQLSQEETA